MTPEKVAIIASGAFLLCGLLTGVWKYKQIRVSAEHHAHPYVDITHRASLLYAFACLVIAEFARRSPLSAEVTYLCVLAPLIFFTLTVGVYIFHGWKQDTENQFASPGPLTSWIMNALIIAEVGGFGVLFFAVAQDMIFGSGN